MLLTTIAGALFLLGCWLVIRCRFTYRHIPGPGLIETLQNVFHVTDPATYHLTLTEMGKKYGPVMFVSQLHRNVVVVSGYEAIHEMLIKKGWEFGGRPCGATARYVERHKGIEGHIEADDKWNALRKIAQQHLKQYGEGLTTIESRVKKASKKMFQAWELSNGKPVDPEPDILQTIVKTMLVLVMGDHPKANDPLITSLEKLFKLVGVLSFNPPWPVIVFDMFPWLRFFRVKTWEMIQQFNQISDEIWQEMKQSSNDAHRGASLIKLLMTTDEQEKRHAWGKSSTITLEESEVRVTVFSIILPGIITTVYTFHAGMNIFAHYQSVQEKIHKEIQKVVGSSNREIHLADRSEMPYTRAVILELLRFMSPVAVNVPHRCVKDSTLWGYKIYKDTILSANLWALNHDEDMWSDPFTFQPERFLDGDGQLVPPDHPNRKQMMAFGTGTRVCLGESIALARLFILITTLHQKFDILPAEGNSKELTNCLKFTHQAAVVHSPKYDVILKARQH